MMCCCRDVEQQEGQTRGGEEVHPAQTHTVRLASFDDDLITPLDADQITNNQSKNWLARY